MTVFNKKRSIVLDIVMFLVGLIWLLPLILILVNIPKTTIEYNLGTVWNLPTDFNIIYNWGELNRLVDFGTAYGNSLFYAIVAPSLGILFAAMAAYAVTSMNIKHKLFWFLVIYIGNIFPAQMYLVPVYKMYAKTGLYDTKLGMILFYTAICIPFCLFLLRNFFSTMSKSILESAKIDGATDWKAFTRLYLPMAKAPISALFLFQASFVWGDLLYGLTFTKSDNARTIMASLSTLQSSAGVVDVPVTFLGCLIASIPTIIIFIVLNKNFDKGFVLSSK